MYYILICLFATKVLQQPQRHNGKVATSKSQGQSRNGNVITAMSHQKVKYYRIIDYGILRNFLS